MSDDAQDDLILRHLDGDTSAAEVAQVTRLLAEDGGFRSRFFKIASLITDVQELVSLSVGGETMPRLLANGNPALVTPRVVPAPAAPPVDWNIDLRRIAQNAILGGFGGLVGWLLFTLLDSLLGFNRLNVYLQDAVKGLVFGVCIGFAVGAAEGLFASRSLRRLLRGGGIGAALGAAGGVIGLVAGEVIFVQAGGGVWPRAVGWGVFGMFVGVSEGVAYKMPVKVRYGILGGLLGGLIGGSTYDGLVAVIRALGFRAEGLAWGSALGLVILGACIGFLISLVESLLRKAWVFFLTGRLEGQTRTLDSSRPHTLGSDPACTIVLPSDLGLAAVHAEIVFEGDHFVIQDRDGAVVIRRDGVDQAVTHHELAAGDRIILGETRMIFRNVERKQS